VDDITEEIEGFVAPCDTHIEQVLNFVRGWIAPRRWLSTVTPASAARPRAPLPPPVCSIRIATKFRSRGKISCRLPDRVAERLIVSLADKALGREGRMLRALDEWDLAACWSKGRPFRIDLE